MVFRRKVPSDQISGLPLFPTVSLDRTTRARNEAAIRALSSNAYLGGRISLCRVLGRYKMFVDTQDIGLSAHLLIDGYWEMWLTEIMVATIKPGMITIDVGANLGYFSLLMAELTGNTGEVHAFEPNATIAALLSKSAEVNGFSRRLHVHQTALGEHDGANYHLVVQPNDPKNAFIIPAAPGTPAGPDLLQIRRLDSYARALDADVVKIDADTAERAIWRGMRGIFDRQRPMTIFVEFNAARYDDPAAFLAEIEAEGFSLAIVDLHDGVVPSSAAQILSWGSAEDQMLMAQR